jgi:hypothetical protein
VTLADAASRGVRRTDFARALGRLSTAKSNQKISGKFKRILKIIKRPDN